MAQKAHGLSRASRYHIVFTPKYRRKVVCSQIRSDIGEILRKLRGYRGIEVIEGNLMPDRVRVLLAAPPKCSVASVMGYLKGKSSPMIFDRRATGQDALGLDEARARAFRREPGARGLYPKSKPPFFRVVLISGLVDWRSQYALAAISRS